MKKALLLKIVTVVGVCAALLPNTPASAIPISGLRLVSGPDPLPAAGTAGACGSTVEFQDWEQEPALAVDPGNNANVVTAWMQDYADAIVTAHSSDGGRSWAGSVPRTTACTGGAPQYGEGSSALDPWLDFGPAYPAVPGAPRTLYLSSVLMTSGQLGFEIAVHRSHDGGRTWSAPATVARSSAPVYFDGSNIVADQARPGRAYVVWRQGDYSFTARQQFVARTDDGGATWSAPLPVPSDDLQVSGHLHVLPDGSLISVFATVPLPPPGTAMTDLRGPTTVLASRSTNLGVTWSTPVVVAVADEVHVTNPSSAVAPDGTVYVSWHRANAGAGTFSLLLSRSSTSGRTWLPTPLVVATQPGDPLLPYFAFPGLAVGRDGTVGVAFYDHRNGGSDSAPGSTTDYWLRTSRNHGETWREQHIAGPFDITTAPLGFVGDYQGIVAHGRGFGLVVTMTGADVGTPPTDVFWVTAG